MIIFDASPLIAIFNSIRRPDVFEDILKLDNNLVITEYVFLELRDPYTRANIEKLLDENKIKLLKKSTLDEIQKFYTKAMRIQDGETDMILTYQKLERYQNNICCIIDDRKARKAALLDIKYTGLLGLLQKLVDKKIKSRDKVNEIIELLDRSSFRMPKDFKINS